MLPFYSQLLRFHKDWLNKRDSQISTPTDDKKDNIVQNKRSDIRESRAEIKSAPHIHIDSAHIKFQVNENLLVLSFEKGFVAVISIFQASHLSGVAQTYETKSQYNADSIYCARENARREKKKKKRA